MKPILIKRILSQYVHTNATLETSVTNTEKLEIVIVTRQASGYEAVILGNRYNINFIIFIMYFLSFLNVSFYKSHTVIVIVPKNVIPV